MLVVGVWHWGDKYGAHYVERLRAGVTRHLKQPHRFEVFRPEPEDEHLTTVQGCFCRLRMFDPAWQERRGIKPGDRAGCMDLDSIVTGELDALFNRAENFMILTGANAANPCPYNGSLWMLRAGYRPDVWSDFSLEAARKVPFYEFPDDQAWLAHKLPGVVGWKVGAPSGVYAFQKPGWPDKSLELPKDARLVAFPGKRDPGKFTHLPWVQEHWRS